MCCYVRTKANYVNTYTVFGKVAGVASEEVTVELLEVKMSTCAVIRS